MSDAAGTISVKLVAGLETCARERHTACESDLREAASVGAAGQAPGPGDEVAPARPLGGG